MLIPLMLWFVINLISIYDKDYADVVFYFTNPTSKFLFSIFIINAYFFSALSISEVFEDYITNNKIKNVANKLLYASAVVIPLITIILITRL
jgi:succinate dehydrogenase / fumarate reductase membrane anchor subunit